MVSITLMLICIAVAVAYASALPGALLLLRGSPLLSDAISHSVLLGIALMFLLVQSLTSVWLFIGAVCAGVATVIATEAITRSGQLKQDAAIGVVFPCFFSIGVLIISLYARDVHLDIDMVALGEIAFAPFYRLFVAGYDIGPRALWIAGSISVCNTLFVYILRKELAAILFDADFSWIVKLHPRYVSYALMILTSITAVGVFEIVGSVVVVALMVTPAVTAYLLVQRFVPLMQLAPVLGSIAAILGYAVARVADVSITGSIAAMSGMVFALVLIVAPQRGLLATWRKRLRYRQRIGDAMVRAYLRECPAYQARKEQIAEHLQWSPSFIHQVVSRGVEQGDLYVDGAYVRYIG